MRFESFLASPESWREKILGAGAGDGAQIRGQFLFAHADAGVGDGERLVRLVELQIDTRVEGQALVGLVGQGQVAQLIQRVGGVRDQFPQKDLRDGNRGNG